MANSVPTGHQLIGKWYNALGNGQYIRFQFTDAGAYAYSSPFKSVQGTFEIQDNQLTLKPSDGETDYRSNLNASELGASPSTLRRSRVIFLRHPITATYGSNQFCK